MKNGQFINPNTGDYPKQDFCLSKKAGHTACPVKQTKLLF
jgi:hypothetical protein